MPSSITAGEHIRWRDAGGLPLLRRLLTRSVGTKAVALAILIVSVAGPGLMPERVPLLLKLLGGVLVVGLVLHGPLRRGIPGEVLFYFTFLLWAGATAFGAFYPVLALRTVWKLLQVGLVFWAVVAAHRRDPDLRFVMFGLWLVGSGWALLAQLKPEVRAGLEGFSRLSALGENPNTGGQIFVFAIFGGLYLLQSTSPIWIRLVLLASLPVFSSLLLLTGSRKMMVAAALMVASWLLVGSRAAMTPRRRRAVYIVLILAVAGVAVTAVSQWRGSPMAVRWERTVEAPAGKGGGFAGRGALYRMGWELFLENPITGVGLMNQARITGHVFHSDYMDVLASTGIVGAILYFSVYLGAFRRARRVRWTSESAVQLEWQAFSVYMIVLVWLMVGFQRYDDLYNIIVLGAFVGFFLGAEDYGRQFAGRAYRAKRGRR